MRIIVVACLICCFGMAQAQDSPTHYTDTTGNLYWRKAAPVYLFVSDSPNGADKQKLTSKTTPQYANPFYLDTEGVNFIRTREAIDPNTMKPVPNTEVMFEIYADGLAPQSAISFQNEFRHRSDTTLYFKSGLTVSLAAKDQLSGVRLQQYTINSGAVENYQSPLVFDKQGSYELVYWSEDQVGNKETPGVLKMVIDPDAPESNLNINGITEEKVVSIASKMYILAGDAVSGVGGVFYRFDEEPFKKYNGTDLPFAVLAEGQHTVTYYSVDNVTNKEAEKSFSFYLDKTAPLMVADVLGDRFLVGDQIYFSGRTKLKLTAVDNKVGVKEIMFSIDNEEFKTYDQPFYLPSVSGVHIIRYYSVDNLQNSSADQRKSQYLGQGGYEEFKHNVSKFYVDLTGPVISHTIGDFSFTRNDTLFIGPFSKIRISGTDPESGVKSLSYSLNDDIGEEDYTGAFTIAQEGYNILNYYGYDNVNNRNIGNFSFYLDATAPQIFIQFSTGSTGTRGGNPMYPGTSGIFLSATDKTSGVNSLSYSLDGAPFKPYAGLITKLGKGKHTLAVKAVDFLNNEAKEEITFFIQ